MTARIVRSTDFARVLRTSAHVRSAHFAIHHVAEGPARLRPSRRKAASSELSTEPAPDSAKAVDDSAAEPHAEPVRPDRCWLGLVVPKRLARRAVTRSLLKRQIRAAFLRHEPSLADGLWVVRLRAPFAREQFPSAASAALLQVVSTEIEALLQHALRPASAA